MSDPWNPEPAPVPEPSAPGEGEAGVLVLDLQTNTPRYIRAADHQSAVASGRFRDYEQSFARVQRGGATVLSTPEEAAVREEPLVPIADLAAQERQRAYDAQFDTAAAKVATVLEGVSSSVSFGLLKSRKEKSDDRRRVLSDYATTGELIGTVGTLLTPKGALSSLTPLGRAAAASEKTGEALGRALMGAARQGERGAVSIGRRAVSEAVSNAALTGAAALGHATTEALLDNKPFAAEHVASAMWDDALLGGGIGLGAGALGEMFKGARSSIRARDYIRAQGGILDSTSAQSARVHEAVRSAVSGWDTALEKHRIAQGALKA
jgi:hypothetical protein